MTRMLGVAGVQVEAVAYDVEATRAKAERLVRGLVASTPWIELVVLPELTLHGFAPYQTTYREGWKEEVAEEIPGPTTEWAQRLAAELGIWFIPGSIYERSGDAIHNTAVVAGPGGELVTRFRKLFPWEPYEGTEPGDDLCLFEIPNAGTVGVCICYDSWYPEVCRALMLAGAELVVHPSGTTTWDRDLELVIARANAIFNQCYFLDVNGTQAVGGGRSIFVGPDGDVLHQAGEGDELFARRIDLDEVARARSEGTLGLNRLDLHLDRALGLVERARTQAR